MDAGQSLLDNFVKIFQDFSPADLVDNEYDEDYDTVVSLCGPISTPVGAQIEEGTSHPFSVTVECLPNFYFGNSDTRKHILCTNETGIYLWDTVDDYCSPNLSIDPDVKLDPYLEFHFSSLAKVHL
eukprot:393309_1